MTYIRLNNGVKIPQIGLGVFKNPPGKITVETVLNAFAAGYRHIDTAMIYENEKSVGDAIKLSGLKRNELFITTKLWNDDIVVGKTKEAFEKSLEKLQVEYIDSYLIHWPVAGFQNAWLEMENLYNEGLARSIGVSNFNQNHLEILKEVQSISPSINQIESHPYFNNQSLIEYCFKNDISVTAWRPLGGTNSEILKNYIIKNIAKKYKKTPAQIIIKWHLQRKVIVIPKTTKTNRICENINVFDFNISDVDMDKINLLNTNKRLGPDPSKITLE